MEHDYGKAYENADKKKDDNNHRWREQGNIAKATKLKLFAHDERRKQDNKGNA